MTDDSASQALQLGRDDEKKNNNKSSHGCEENNLEILLNVLLSSSTISHFSIKLTFMHINHSAATSRVRVIISDIKTNTLTAAQRELVLGRTQVLPNSHEHSQ